MVSFDVSTSATGWLPGWFVDWLTCLPLCCSFSFSFQYMNVPCVRIIYYAFAKQINDLPNTLYFGVFIYLFILEIYTLHLHPTAVAVAVAVATEPAAWFIYVADNWFCVFVLNLHFAHFIFTAILVFCTYELCACACVNGSHQFI